MATVEMCRLRGWRLLRCDGGRYQVAVPLPCELFQPVEGYHVRVDIGRFESPADAARQLVRMVGEAQ